MLESLLRGDSKACGACMVTASHLPKEWNGLKLFSAKEQRGLNKKEVKEVLGLAADLADMMEPVAGDIASAPSSAAVKSTAEDRVRWRGGDASIRGGTRRNILISIRWPASWTST